jgi:hypothetical protein
MSEYKLLPEVVDALRERVHDYNLPGYFYSTTDAGNFRLVQIEIERYKGVFDQCRPLITEYQIDPYSAPGSVRRIIVGKATLVNIKKDLGGEHLLPLRPDQREDVIGAIYRCSIDCVGLRWQTGKITYEIAKKIHRFPLPVWEYTHLEPLDGVIARISHVDTVYTNKPEALEVSGGYLQFKDGRKPEHAWLVIVGEGRHGPNGPEYYGYHSRAALGPVPEDFLAYKADLEYPEPDTGMFRTAPICIPVENGNGRRPW